MKLSNISVIFIIIVIPIILMMSYYISLQIDTINMQTAYTSKQLRATKEAIEAFEINTVEWNEVYSENADSKRRDVMASINTFTTSFANSIGIGGTNKENILPYIPAIAATLYDGYYIYTPSETKEVIRDKDGVAVFLIESLVGPEDEGFSIPKTSYTYEEEDKGKLLYVYDSETGGAPDGIYKYTDQDGNDVEKEFTFNSDNAVSTYEHILKPFSTYSARYKTDDKDITVNYTLDNYITIYGTINEQPVKKSGYLIKARNDLIMSSETLTEKIAWRWNEDGDYTCADYTYVYAEDNTKVYFDGDTTFWVSSTGIRTDLNNTTDIKYKKIRKSSWEATYQALNTVTIKDRNDNDIIIEQGTCYIDKMGTVDNNLQGEDIDLKKDYSSRNYYIESIDFTEWVVDNLSDIQIRDMQDVADKSIYGNVDDYIFNFEATDPESEYSIINTHKREVIKQTLISNLNQAITSYSRTLAQGEYRLPILTETDWDHILRNVSIVTFVQNLPIGMKYYNNYAVATSTTNKEFVQPDYIYLTKQGDSYYHLPYCNQLSNDASTTIGYRNIDFIPKTYDKKESNGITNTIRYYKHSYTNTSNQECYYCLVQRDLYTSEGLSNQKLKEQDTAYKIALARERYRNISEINLIDELDLRILVRFHANGGSELITEKRVAYQGKYKDGDPTGWPTPTKEGYNFVGWFLVDEGEEERGNPIKGTDDVLIVNDHDLYAHWGVQEYIVSFHTNGGDSISPNWKSVTYGNPYGELPTPTRTGYTFKGWYTAISGGTEIDSTTRVEIASNHILYAHWEANQYIVSFSGPDSYEPITVTYGSPYGELPTPSNFESYREFKGWYTEQNGEMIKIESSTIVSIASDHILIAKTKPKDAEEYNGHYYKVCGPVSTWEEAKQACEAMGGHLVTITSEEEQKFINDNIIPDNDDNTYNFFWIGATDEGDEGKWKWVTGENFVYKNWSVSLSDSSIMEPNNGNKLNNLDGENYLQMYGKNYSTAIPGTWNDVKNNTNRLDHYICEWDN